MLTDFGSGAIGPEIMAQSPSPDLQFSRTPVPVESTSGEEPAGHWFHKPVNHIAGAISLGILESQDKAFSFSRQFFNRQQSSPGDGLPSPGLKLGHLLAKVSGIRGVIDVPDVIFDLGQERFQAFAAVLDFEKSVQKTLNQGNGYKQGLPGFLGR